MPQLIVAVPPVTVKGVGTLIPVICAPAESCAELGARRSCPGKLKASHVWSATIVVVLKSPLTPPTESVVLRMTP
jgi:hypothetical protein